MSFPRSGAAALALVFSASLAATGCGGSGDPLAGLSANQVVSKAVSGLGSQSHFSITGTIISSGRKLSMTLGYKPPTSCEGTIGMGRGGSFAMTAIGTAVWIKPDTAFWKANGGASAQQAIALLGGKYLKTTTADANMADVSKLCNVAKLSSSMLKTSTGKVTKGKVTTIDGQSALTLKDSAKGGTLYVTDTSSPRILQVTNPSKSDGGTLKFSYGPVTVTPPPASETVDGSKYGF